MNDKPLTYFAPCIPIPRVWDQVRHLRDLKYALNPECPHYCFIEGMKPNLRAVIHAYETGKMPSHGTVYFKRGEMVSEAEANIRDTFVWTERVGHIVNQRANRQVYTSFPGQNHHSHQILMEVRLCPELGGDGTRHGISVLNDTGSDVLTIFNTDLTSLGNYEQYTGWLGFVDICGCNGDVEMLLSLMVEIRLVRPGSLVPWGNWLSEEAILRQPAQGVARLSGSLMRERLFFGTRPGNYQVAVSDTKGGLNAII